MQEHPRIRLEQYYAGARERANRAAATYSRALGGMTVLNAVAVGGCLTALALRETVKISIDIQVIEDSARHFIHGAVLGIVAVAVFALSSFFRSYSELASAEWEGSSAGAERQRRESDAKTWLVLYVVALVASGAMGAIGLGLFGEGCFHVLGHTR
jgi:hypothetical protein